MRARTHIFLFLLCVAAVFGFAMLGLSWSLADYHPDRAFNEQVANEQAARTSEMGMAMWQLFIWPLMALTRVFGESSVLMLFARAYWIIMPLVYGGLLHLLLWASMVKLPYFFRRKNDATEPTPTGWE